MRNSLRKIKQKQIEIKNKSFFFYHCSGLTNKQWRYLKSILNTTKGHVVFQPNGTCVKGPLCLLYSNQNNLDSNIKALSHVASQGSRPIDLLTKLSSLEPHLILLYAQTNSSVKLNHVDVKAAVDLNKDNVLNMFLNSFNEPVQQLISSLNTNTPVEK